MSLVLARKITSVSQRKSQDGFGLVMSADLVSDGRCRLDNTTISCLSITIIEAVRKRIFVAVRNI